MTCVIKMLFNWVTWNTAADIVNRLKANSVNLKVELYLNGELIDPNNDRKLVSQIGIRDKTVSSTFDGATIVDFEEHLSIVIFSICSSIVHLPLCPHLPILSSRGMKHILDYIVLLEFSLLAMIVYWRLGMTENCNHTKWIYYRTGCGIWLVGGKGANVIMNNW